MLWIDRGRALVPEQRVVTEFVCADPLVVFQG